MECNDVIDPRDYVTRMCWKTLVAEAIGLHNAFKGYWNPISVSRFNHRSRSCHSAQDSEIN